MRRATMLAFVMISALTAACADQLPDQDRRILEAAPDAKISTDLLWTEYQGNADAANKRYWGKVLEVTGRVSSVTQTPPGIVFLAPQSQNGVEARLLDDQAGATLAAATVGERLTLHCFCAGLDKNVILKSCIKP